MNLIYISDSNGLIGIDNKLVFNISEDLKFFKEKTSGTDITKSVLIVGYNTYLTLPIKKILTNNRILWVVTKKFIPESDSEPDVKFFTHDNIINTYQTNINKYNWWVIGGKQIYKLFESIATNIFHSYIDTEIKTISQNCVKYTHPPYFKLQNKILAQIVLDHNTNTYYNLSINHLVNRFDESYYSMGQNTVGEYQYLNILYKTLVSPIRQTRNGFTYSYFGDQMRFDLTKGFPLLTTKKMFFKGIIHELLFFIRGQTNSLELEKSGVNIWKPNTARE